MYKIRNDFGKLFQTVYDTGAGAEIGVQNGYNSKKIAEFWTGKIFCVDVWTDSERFAEACQVLSNSNVILVRADSIKAARALSDESLDWVYIDAGHSYKEVKADFEAWFPKVRYGGIVSGHDYGDNDCIGVKQFIDEYMKLNPDVKMNFTTEDFWEGKEYQSWWFVKCNK